MNDLSNHNDNKGYRRPVQIITGMSGAGLSSALGVFEDLGYEAVDNLRLGLVPVLLDGQDMHPLAIAVDTRNTNFSVDAIARVYDLLRGQDDLAPHLIFLECSDSVLLERYEKTKRLHPLAQDRPVSDGIKAERDMLTPLLGEADLVIDTTELTTHDLRRLIAGHFPLNNKAGLSLFVTSFSYRHGLPREADLVFDVRFLRDPYNDSDIRELTGEDERVVAYIKEDEEYQDFMDGLLGLLLPLLPRYQQEGKSYLTIAVGCSGGLHRSVMVAEQLTTILASKGYIVGIGHRDIAHSLGQATKVGE